VAAGARETFETVCNLVHRYDDPGKAMQAAVKLGGDTDTVAAIVGGILG
jgi:ADP-ribosylglycohydrolase